MVKAWRIVYQLESVSDPSRHYTGITSNLAVRLVAHNEGHCPQTATNRPWRVLVSIEFASEHSAALFERYLKSGSGRVFATRGRRADHAAQGQGACGRRSSIEVGKP